MSSNAGSGDLGPLPSFERPPVTEVAYGVAFAPLAAFMIPHYGLLWERLRGDYPRVEHAPPIGFPGADIVEPTTGLPLPRVWMISADDVFLVQYQRDRLLANWRRRDDSQAYPRFPAIADRFWSALRVFREFVSEYRLGEVAVRSCELVYINNIPEGDGWHTVAEIGRLLPHVAWQGGASFLADPINVAWRAEFPLRNAEGSLTVELKRGVRIKDAVPTLILELTARGIGEDRTDEGITRWMEAAHENIVRGFADLTSEEAQKTLWRRDGLR